MKKNAAKSMRRIRSIKPGVYRIAGTNQKVRITKSSSWSVIPFAQTYGSEKIPIKVVKPGILELEYTPSEEVSAAVKMAE